MLLEEEIGKKGVDKMVGALKEVARRDYNREWIDANTIIPQRTPREEVPPLQIVTTPKGSLLVFDNILTWGIVEGRESVINEKVKEANVEFNIRINFDPLLPHLVYEIPPGRFEVMSDEELAKIFRAMLWVIRGALRGLKVEGKISYTFHELILEQLEDMNLEQTP